MPEEMKVRWTYRGVTVGSKESDMVIPLGRDFPGYEAKAGTSYPELPA
jgi:hypothetical protein